MENFRAMLEELPRGEMRGQLEEVLVIMKTLFEEGGPAACEGLSKYDMDAMVEQMKDALISRGVFSQDNSGGPASGNRADPVAIVSTMFEDLTRGQTGPFTTVTRGHIASTDSIINKARKFVELCDGPIYPDFEKPPGASQRCGITGVALYGCGEKALWASHCYDGETVRHCEYPTFP
jgi:hypothetical protein